MESSGKAFKVTEWTPGFLDVRKTQSQSLITIVSFPLCILFSPYAYHCQESWTLFEGNREPLKVFELESDLKSCFRQFSPATACGRQGR